jgi:phenylpyruvate tautomerase PptA (4-oxalocrotonate tautomerase family)
MPVVHIHLARGRPPAQKKAILQGVHAALREAFQIPDHDRNLILHEHDPDAFDSAKGPEFTLVEVTAFAGRSREAKRALFAAVVRNLERDPGIAPQKVTIIVHEPPLDCWGIRGGKPAGEVDLGFKVDV